MLTFFSWFITGCMISNLCYVVYYIYVVVYGLSSLFVRWWCAWLEAFRCTFVSTRTLGVCLWLRIGFYVSGTCVLIIVASTSGWIRLSTGLRNQRLVVGWTEVLQPWISPKFLRRWSVISFVLHASGDYSSWSRWHMVRNGQISSLYFTVQVLIILSSKRKLSTKESKEQNSTCIYICWWSTIFCLLDYFWSHVWRRSTKHFNSLIIWDACAKSKIYQFHISPFIQHHIFQFDISMSNASRMKVMQRIDELNINSSGFIFLHSSMRFAFQEAVSRATRNILKDEDYLVLCLNGLIQSCNIWVRYSFHQSNFSSNRLLSLNIFYLFFFINLQC